MTGASAGIGAVFARRLAARGANVVLTARRLDRLEALSEDLKREHGVETRVIAADFADPAAPEAVMRLLTNDGIEVDILVNNAGFGLPGYFDQSPWPAHRDFLTLMVTSYAHFVHLTLPGMKARGFGRIIQVASLAGLTPGSAGHTMYGASKAFLVSFSQSLAAETEGAGVEVCALCPGFTYSEFHDVNQTRGLVSQLPSYMFMQPGPVVDGALAAIERGHVVYAPGLWNKFAAWMTKALPRPWAAELVKRQSRKFRKSNA